MLDIALIAASLKKCPLVWTKSFHFCSLLESMALIVDNQGLASLIDGTQFDDSILGLDRDDTINGLDGQDFINGGSGDDIIDAGADDDTITQSSFFQMGENAGSGDDFLDGGTGTDTVSYSFLGAAVTLGGSGEILKDGGALGTDTIRNVETIIGDPTQNNRIDGTLNAGGNARFDIDLEPDMMFPVMPRLTVIPEVPNSFFPAPISFTVFNFNEVIGTINDDTIRGSQFDDTIAGAAGDDFISGRGGNDLLGGESGNDTVLGSGGNDTIVGDIGNDLIDGGGSNSPTGNVLDYSIVGGFGVTLGGSGVILKDGGVEGTDTISSIDTIVGDAFQSNVIDGELNASGNAFFDINLEEETLIVNPLVANTFFPEPVSFNVINFQDVVGTVNNDIIIGSSDDNVVVGSRGNDGLDGLGGFDVLTYENLDNTSITLTAFGFVSKASNSGLLLGTDSIDGFEVIEANSTGLRNTVDGEDVQNAQISVDLDANSLSVVVFDADFPNPLDFTIVNFDNVRGTAENDTIAGDLQDNLFLGSGGNDFYDGRDGVDTISYAQRSGSITIGGSGEIVKGDGTDTIRNIETIIGNSNAFNEIDGTLNAEGNASLEVDLTAGTLVVTPEVPNTFFPGPISFNIEGFIDVKGTVNDDTIVGFADDLNFFFGTDGNDEYDGVGSFSGGNGALLRYDGLGNGVTFNAAQGTDNGSGTVLKALGIRGTDTFTNVSAVAGDIDQRNIINGQNSADAGASFEIDFRQSGTPPLAGGRLIVNNSDGMVASKTFAIANFVDVIGTNNDDEIRADGNANEFFGEGGDDFIFGRGGRDNIFGGEGDDELLGGGGRDLLSGGNGSDFLRAGKGDDEIIGVGDTLGANDFDTLKGDAGADRFILGDGTNIFYEGIGFAEIRGFEKEVDKLILTGSADDYTFENRQIISNGDLIATFNRRFFESDIEFVNA